MISTNSDDSGIKCSIRCEFGDVPCVGHIGMEKKEKEMGKSELVIFSGNSSYNGIKCRET